LVELTLDLAVQLVATSRDDLRKRLHDGSAWRKFVAMVLAQGGDASALEKMREVHRAPVITDVPASADGIIVELDALQVGRLCVQLGAGRAKAGDAVDFAVGIECLRKEGDRVVVGEPVLRVHSRKEVDPAAVAERVFTIA
jgi:thymidine phosphorylase